MKQTDILMMVKDMAIKKGDRLYLKCPDAFKIANDNNIQISEIGKICNENNIKICNCQLGCF